MTNMLAGCFGLLTALLLFYAQPLRGQSVDCQALADHYLEKHHKEAAPYTGENLLYFLHVPRTAGRTFHSCLLKMGVHPARRCPKAYDHLRLTNMSFPRCFLLSSHDDFSVVSMLPPDAAVLSQMRDPMDRFISAYEFAIEVAARSLRRPKNVRKKVQRIATEDVWPWSYLIPFFAEDMRPKVDAAQAVQVPEGGRWIEVEEGGERWYYNKALNQSVWNLTDEQRALGVASPLNPYDNELVMSLKDFALHPIASELLHNGGAFQVLGITNYSHWGDAGSFRTCLQGHLGLQRSMQTVAESRIKRFAHVGTTDRLFESAASALVSMHMDVASPAYSGGDEDVAGRGGVRRRGAMAEGESAEGGASRRGGAAAQLQLMAKLVREARQRLQSLQKELVDAQKAGADRKTLSDIRNRIDTARQALIDAQDKMADAREALPERLGGRAGAARAAGFNGGRRRLMQAESEEAGAGAQAAAGGDGAAQEGAAIDNSYGKAEEQEGEEAEDEDEATVVERRRRLASTHAAKLDGFGNPLDPEFKRIPNTDVGHEFMRCANRAQERSASRRDQSLAVLSTSDGRRVAFSKAARKRILEEVLEIIRSRNTMDAALHKLGSALLDDKIAAQKAAGLYQDMPQLPKSEPAGKDSAGGRKFGIPKPQDESGGGAGGKSDEL